MAYENRVVQSGTTNTLPTGTDPLVDNTASGDVQAIKILDGTAGSTTPITGDANGLDVDVTRLPALVAGTANIGDVDVLTLPSIPAGTNTIGSVKITDGTDTALVDASGNLMVNVAAGGAGDGAILDGVSSAIKATVLDYTNSNPLAVRLTDTNGDFASAGGGTQYTEDAAAAADPIGTALNLVRKDTPASEVSADGDNIAARGNSAGAQYVELLSGTAKVGGDATNGLDVDVTRVSGNVTVVQSTATNLKVDASGVAVPVTDNSGSLTVDNGGTFAVQATVAAGATNIAKAEDAASADLDVGVPAMAVRKATPVNTSGLDGDYEMLQMSAGRLWTSATVDAALPAGTNAIGKLAANDGVDVGDVTINNASGASSVNIQDGGNSITVDGTITANLAAGTNTNEMVGDVAHDAVIAGNPITIGGVASAAAPTDVSADQDAVRAWYLRNGAQATVLTAAGALIGGDAANGIDVDVTRLPASTNTLEVVGDVAHDAVAAGNPVLIAASAETMADSAPANRVSADADATRISATDGAIYVIPTGPQTWSYHSNGSSALTDASVHAAPGAGLSLYVTDIVCSTGSATAMNIFFEEGATTVLGPYYLEAVAGRGVVIRFGTPKKITANTALTVTTSAAIAQAIDVQGFIAPG